LEAELSREDSMKLPQFVLDALADLEKRTKFLSAPPSGPFPDVLAKVIVSHPWPNAGSNNWSGGYVTPREGDSITSVEANWTVPAVQAPSVGGASDYFSSTWIGLDGQRSYRDSTLPQIGTMQQFTVGTGATYIAWYQWWAKDTTPILYPLPNLPVNAGDEVSASLTVLNSTKVRFDMKNVTQTSTLPVSFEVDAPSGYLISGATAEWIMERPTPLVGGDPWTPYPLPKYQAFSFTGCRAKTTAPTGAASKVIDLELARLIRMNEITVAPPGLRTISVAKKTLLPAQRLDLTYTGPL
jgi:hypothetical protein